MKKIDKTAAPVLNGTRYPEPYDQPCRARSRIRLGDAAGLEQFGVNLCRLPPGAWSSQRHWHTEEDEFVYVVEGELVLVTDEGEETLRAGDCAGFKAGRGRWPPFPEQVRVGCPDPGGGQQARRGCRALS